MTNHTDVSDLSLVVHPSSPVWSAATDVLDERLEIAVIDAEGRIAVRDRHHPAAPALVFSDSEWRSLIGSGPDLVDLR